MPDALERFAAAKSWLPSGELTLPSPMMRQLQFLLPSIMRAMAPPAQPPVYPLYIRVEPPDAEELPCEILWETRKNFMVLDPEGRWPIGRLVSVQRRPAPLQRAIGTELRKAVVLAAARENGANEWASIAKAINELNLPVDMLALVSEDDAQKAIVANADEWLAEAPGRKVTVELLETAPR